VGWRVRQLALSAAVMLLVSMAVPARAQRPQCPRHGDCIVVNLVKAAMAATTYSIGCAVAASSQTPGNERGDDNTLTEQVVHALRAYPDAQVRRIHVDVRDRVVRLEGVVQSLVQKNLADDIARNVSGVRAVRSDVDIRPDRWPGQCNFFNVAVSAAQCVQRVSPIAASTKAARCCRPSSDRILQANE